MIQCRNTLVAVKLITKAEHKVGHIVVLADNDTFCEAEILAVGPGCVAAEGGRSETHDLKVGQRVWINHAKNKMRGDIKVGTTLQGISYTEGEEEYHIFEEKSIFAIIAHPLNEPIAIPYNPV